MSMKIWGKRMLALACAGAMLVPLAACGSDADAGKIRLSYLSWDNEQTSKPYIDEFEKENPDIKIDFSYAPPTSEYISTLQTRLVGNQAPDVFIITSENRDDLIDNGYAKDLTDESFMKNISQANKDFVGRDGKTYGMSITSWVSGIAYNKDLLKQVGYDEPPANWDDFLKLCKKLKNAGIEPFLEPNADEPSRFIDAFQGSILEKKGVDPTTLSTQDNQTPGTDELEAVKEYIRLYDEGGVTRGHGWHQRRRHEDAVHQRTGRDDRRRRVGLCHLRTGRHELGLCPDAQARRRLHAVRAGLRLPGVGDLREARRRQAQGRREVPHLPVKQVGAAEA